jgi:hypothetical protein
LPDVGGELPAGVAELGVDGPELLGLGDIDGTFDHPPDDLLDPGPELLQEGLDAFLAGGLRRRGLPGAGRGHGSLHG